MVDNVLSLYRVAGWRRLNAAYGEQGVEYLYKVFVQVNLMR